MSAQPEPSDDTRRKIGEINAAIDALLEEGVAASSSRVRALRAKKAVLQNGVCKAQHRMPIKTPQPSRQERQSSIPAKGRKKPRSDRIKDVNPVSDALVAIARTPQASKAAKRLHRRAFEQASRAVTLLRSIGLPRTVDEADTILDEIQWKIAQYIDGSVDYPRKLRATHGDQRRAAREVRQALKWRRRTVPVEPAELAEILYSWSLREVARRRDMPADARGVVGMIQVRSGGAPSLGKRK